MAVCSIDTRSEKEHYFDQIMHKIGNNEKPIVTERGFSYIYEILHDPLAHVQRARWEKIHAARISNLKAEKISRPDTSTSTLPDESIINSLIVPAPFPVLPDKTLTVHSPTYLNPVNEISRKTEDSEQLNCQDERRQAQTNDLDEFDEDGDLDEVFDTVELKTSIHGTRRNEPRLDACTDFRELLAEQANDIATFTTHRPSIEENAVAADNSQLQEQIPRAIHCRDTTCSEKTTSLEHTGNTPPTKSEFNPPDFSSLTALQKFQCLRQGRFK